MKRFSKVHLVIVLASCVAVTPPARATYQDSIILQFLIQKFNYIMEYVNKAGFALEHLTKQLGSTSVTNAHKQATEVKSGVIAEQTKTLGKIKYAVEFGGEIARVNKGGRSFIASSVSSVGCALKDLNEKQSEAEDKQSQLTETVKHGHDDIKEFPGSMEGQRKKINKSAKEFIDNAKTPVLAPGGDIAEEESASAAAALAVVINKRTYPKEHGRHSREGGGMLSVDYYRQLTETISDVAASNYTKGVSINGEASLNSHQKVSASMRTSENYITANNLKSAKGSKFDLVEGNYSLLKLRLEQLNELRQQEKLHTIRALAALRKFHKEQLK